MAEVADREWPEHDIMRQMAMPGRRAEETGVPSRWFPVVVVD